MPIARHLSLRPPPQWPPFKLPSSAKEIAWANAAKYSLKNKQRAETRCVSLEAAPRFELGVRVLQTPALPLGYAAL